MYGLCGQLFISLFTKKRYVFDEDFSENLG